MFVHARVALLSGLLLAVACGDDDEPKDGGADAALSGDAAMGDAAPADAMVSSTPFGPCESDADCPKNTFCDKQITGSIPVNGLPSGMLDQSLFPGGSCSPKPLAPFDSAMSCDTTLPQPVQGCGSKGTCVLESVNDETLAGCRAACEPSATSSGCAREGYTCDFSLHACIEGCRSDAECRIAVRDNNRDGTPDTYVIDEDSNAVCDPKTARCTHSGKTDVPTGAPCERLDDCSAGGSCFLGPRAIGGLDFPGGYCTAAGCDVPGRECKGDHAVCEPIRPWLGTTSDASLCLISCEVGAEPEEQRFGANGHGTNCRDGYRCHYNGGDGAANGVCVGGVYNDVRTNNIGKECTSNAECYSPYGYGTCLLYSATEARIRAPRGTCSILDCNAPGLPKNICGSGNECLAFAGDLTFCIANCETADDCAAGYACTDDDADPTTASVCFPACAKNADCRATETCQRVQGSTAGRCVAKAGSSG